MPPAITPNIFQLLIILVWLLGSSEPGRAQPRRNIKVVLQSRQSGNSSRDTLQGSGGVIIRRGAVNPSARVTADDRQTTVQRSSGIYTLVADGGESILAVAARVPQSEIAYDYNDALGARYVERQIAFTDVGTSLRVDARILPDRQINLRLTPRISYFSADHPGAVDFTEAATELIVPNGQAVSLGGSTANLPEVTRQILGYRNRAANSDTGLVVTATVQNLN